MTFARRDARDEFGRLYAPVEPRPADLGWYYDGFAHRGRSKVWLDTWEAARLLLLEDA